HRCHNENHRSCLLHKTSLYRRGYYPDVPAQRADFWRPAARKDAGSDEWKDSRIGIDRLLDWGDHRRPLVGICRTRRHIAVRKLKRRGQRVLAMNLSTLTHIHLLLNHFPTIGFGIGFGLFLVAFYVKSD